MRDLNSIKQEPGEKTKLLLKAFYTAFHREISLQEEAFTYI